MTIAAIRKQVKKSIDAADDTTVKMIQAMLEVQKAEQVTELEHRFLEMEQGKGITLTIGQLEERARASFKKRVKAVK
jgi:hypothetical protein